MKTNTIVLTSVFGLVFASLSVVALFFIMSISLNNQDAVLRNTLKAKESAREAVYDETWKSIKQIAQVTDKYAGDFKEVFPKLMEGRYGNARGGALLSFVTEANPTLDPTLYTKLANVIEAKRAEFTTTQKQLLDLKREHDNLLDTFPGTFFVRNKEKVGVKVISSTRSKEAVETGIDDDTKVF